MAVFPGYKLSDMWELPFSVILPLAGMAEAQRKETAFVHARGVVSSGSKEGMKSLASDRECVTYLDPKKAQALRSQANIERANLIAQSILNNKKQES